ncbi:DNA packaging terminase subunit 4 [Anguillid herpesvirus 1]|nr:DNA packaging terminase subunit 4 [Anguillid herpesvirus 1]
MRPITPRHPFHGTPLHLATALDRTMNTAIAYEYPEGFDRDHKVADTLGNMCFEEQLNDGFTDHVLKTVQRLELGDSTSAQLTVEFNEQPNLRPLSSADRASLIMRHGIWEGNRQIKLHEQAVERELATLQIRKEAAMLRAAQAAEEKAVFDKLCAMIDCIIRFLIEHEQNGVPFRLEPFQMEILRGMVLGCAERQLGVALYKYKHKLLDRVGLASPAVARFNPEINNPRLLAEVDELFDHYTKCYMVATVPRRCGKTTVVAIVLAAMLSFLPIDIMVQAQSLSMSKEIHVKMEGLMNKYKAKPWFPEQFKYIARKGCDKAYTYIFPPGAKPGKTTAHFLSSSHNVSTWLSFFLLVGKTVQTHNYIPLTRSSMPLKSIPNSPMALIIPAFFSLFSWRYCFL